MTITSKAGQGAMDMTNKAIDMTKGAVEDTIAMGIDMTKGAVEDTIAMGRPALHLKDPRHEKERKLQTTVRIFEIIMKLYHARM